MSEFYRDRTEGAIARRQDLLRKRRDELVLTPHAVRRVVVARAARAAASMAAIVCGVFLVAVALSPKLAAGVAHFLPGINPAVISTTVGATWILAVIAFAISRGRSEHRFAVAMSTYVLPGEDLDEDIERLSHERPDKVAREMAHRLEIASAALPVAAAALVLPATAIYLAQMIAVGGWPSTATYESDLAFSGNYMLYVGIAGIFAAIAMTQPALRRTSVTPIAAIVSLAAAGLATRSLFAMALTSLWVFTAIGVIAGAIALVTWRLGRERVAIDAQDPAAGAELFTVGGAIRSLRRAMARASITPRMAGGVAAFGVIALVAGSPVVGAPTRRADASPRIVKAGDIEIGEVGNQPVTASRYALDPMSDGRMRITATFVEGRTLVIRDGLLGLRNLPAGWQANVTIMVEDDFEHELEVTPSPDAGSRRLSSTMKLATFSLDACDGTDRALQLRLAPDADWHGTTTVAVYVQATLQLAHCGQ